VRDVQGDVPVSLLDELDEPEDFTGRIRRTANGRPYVLANPDWTQEEREARGFTFKPIETRAHSALYTRVTTYVSCLEDTYALGDWQQRMVLIGAAQRPSLIQRVQNVDLVGNPVRAKAELDQIAQEAKDAAGWKEKADQGSAFHRTAEICDSAGGLDPAYLFSRDTQASLAAYREKTAGWEYAHIESGMVNDEFRTYGTPDRLRVLPFDGSTLASATRTYSGRLRVTDIKTGRIDYGWQKMELQLALYALSDLYDPETGIRTELDIDQEYAEIVHVPQGAGTADVHVVPLGPAMEALRDLVPRTRAYRARKRTWGVTAGESATDPRAAAWQADVTPVPPGTVPYIEDVQERIAAHRAANGIEP
jgi:hypothetical protein